MGNKKKQHPGGEAVIADGCIVISLPIKNLPMAVKLGSDIMAIDPPLRVTDAKALAKEMVSALNAEDEEGTTAIHRLFDQAVSDAAEQGAEGIEPAPEEDES